MNKKLYKSNKNKMIFGVCGGIGEYFNIDATVVRIIFIILVLLHGSGLILYLLTALIMPNGDKYDDIDIDNLKSANMDSEKKEENKSHRGSSNNTKSRSDEEFNSYFNK